MCSGISSGLWGISLYQGAMLLQDVLHDKYNIAPSSQSGMTYKQKNGQIQSRVPLYMLHIGFCSHLSRQRVPSIPSGRKTFCLCIRSPSKSTSSPMKLRDRPAGTGLRSGISHLGSLVKITQEQTRLPVTFSPVHTPSKPSPPLPRIDGCAGKVTYDGARKITVEQRDGSLLMWRRRGSGFGSLAPGDKMQPVSDAVNTPTPPTHTQQIILTLRLKPTPPHTPPPQTHTHTHTHTHFSQGVLLQDCQDPGSLLSHLPNGPLRQPRYLWRHVAFIYLFIYLLI